MWKRQYAAFHLPTYLGKGFRSRSRGVQQRLLSMSDEDKYKPQVALLDRGRKICLLYTDSRG